MSAPPGMPQGQPGNYAAPSQGWQAPNAAAGTGVFQQPAPANKKMPIIFVAVVLAIVVLAVALVFAVRYVQGRSDAVAETGASSSDTGSIPIATATTPTATATDPVVAPTAALTAPTATATGTSVFDQQPTAAVTATTPAPTQTAAPTATQTAAPTATQAHTNPTPTAVNHPTPTPTPTANHPTPTPTPTPTSGGFDQAAANKSLHGMESILSSCKQPNGPTGAGTVRVTFANDGSAMSSVMVGAPYEGTPVGECAANRFKLARVPKFDGPPGITNYRFTIAK